MTSSPCKTDLRLLCVDERFRFKTKEKTHSGPNCSAAAINNWSSNHHVTGEESNHHVTREESNHHVTEDDSRPINASIHHAGRKLYRYSYLSVADSTEVEFFGSGPQILVPGAPHCVEVLEKKKNTDNTASSATAGPQSTRKRYCVGLSNEGYPSNNTCFTQQNGPTLPSDPRQLLEKRTESKTTNTVVSAMVVQSLTDDTTLLRHDDTVEVESRHDETRLCSMPSFVYLIMLCE